MSGAEQHVNRFPTLHVAHIVPPHPACHAQKKKKKTAAAAGDGEAAVADDDEDGEVPAAGEAAESGEPAAKSASQVKREKQKIAAARKKAEAEAEGGAAAAERKEGEMRAAAAAISWSTELRGIKTWTSFPAAEKGGQPQTWPPSVPIAKMFPSGNVPMGQNCEYVGDQAWRTTKAELREMERIHNIQYQELRTAAECHRQVRARHGCGMPTHKSARHARPLAPSRTCTATVGSGHTDSLSNTNAK